MKQITKKQIDETISKVATEVSKNVCEILLENIEAYEKGMDEIKPKI